MDKLRFFKNMTYYFIGNIATKIIQFLFLPLYTKFINPADFGYFDLVSTILIIAIPILFQSIWDGILRFCIDAKNERESREILSTIVIYVISLVVLYSPCIFILKSRFNYSMYIYITIVAQVLSFIWSFASRAYGMNKQFTIANFLSVLITILCNVYFIAYKDMKVEGLFLSGIVGSFSVVLILEIKLRIIQNIKGNDFSLKKLKEVLLYTTPLIFANISWQLINLSSRVLIPYMLGMKLNGIYSISSRFPSIISIITSVYTLAWQEEAIRSEKNNSSVYIKTFNILHNLCFGFIYIVLPFTYLIFPFLIKGDYIVALNYIPILYLSTIYITLSSHFTGILLKAKDTKSIMKLNTIGAFLSIILMVLFSPKLKLYGVALSSLVSGVFRLIYSIYLSQKCIDIKINYKKFIISFSIFVLLYILSALNLIYLSLLLGVIISLLINRDIISYFFKKVGGKN